jgi:hypothetical protein
MQKDYVPLRQRCFSRHLRVRRLRPSVFQSSQNLDATVPAASQNSTCVLNGWKILTGQGDAIKDPYPEKPA